MAHLLASASQCAFSILIVLIPFRSRLVLHEIDLTPIYGDYTDILLFAGDIAHIALLVLWTGRLIIERRRPSLAPWFTTWPLLGILAVSAASSFQSIVPEISWHHVLRLSLLFGLYLYIANEIRDFKILVPAVAVQVGIQSAVAIGQHLAQHSLGLAYLGELELDPAWQGVSIVWAPGAIALRSYGLTDHPNILGGSLALGMVFLVAMYPGFARRQRLLPGAVIAAGTIALLVSFSRTGWLAFAGGISLLIFRHIRMGHRDQLKKVFKLGLVCLVVSGPILLRNLPFLVSRFGLNPLSDPVDNTLLSPEGASIAERAALADAANEMFVNRPLTGLGLGTFPVALQQFRPEFDFYYQPVHMVLMDAAVETGLFGGLAYALAVLLPFSAAAALPGGKRGSKDLAAANAVFLAVVIIGLFDYYPWFLVPGRLWLWSAWGFIAAAYLRAARHHE